jgi:hypothetical protein
VRFPPFLSGERRARLFDGCQAALVWLAVLACVVSDPAVERLALAAMAAAALAAAFVGALSHAGSNHLHLRPACTATCQCTSTTKEDENDVL